ncbi:MAG: S-layer homology domain-containing protein, partial [Andreesenia angusta]|nr:S-layer homology domain-containing protein [Andreesenia angusta]
DTPDTPDKKYDSKSVYIDGYKDGRFKPDKDMSRAEVAKVLAYALTSGFDEEEYTNNFRDVDEKAWYSNILGYMKEINAIEGYPDGKYNPDKAVTRAEFAKIISKIDGLKESKNNKFKDVDNNHWAKKYIESVAEKGYIIGYPDGSFKADNEITRAEVVAIVNRLLGKQLKSYKDKKDLKVFKDMNKEHWAYWDIIAATNK